MPEQCTSSVCIDSWFLARSDEEERFAPLSFAWIHISDRFVCVFVCIALNLTCQMTRCSQVVFSTLVSLIACFGFAKYFIMVAQTWYIRTVHPTKTWNAISFLFCYLIIHMRFLPASTHNLKWLDTNFFYIHPLMQYTHGVTSGGGDDPEDTWKCSLHFSQP